MIVYEVYKNSDPIEGRGISEVVGRFTNYFVAKYVEEMTDGVMGTRSGVGIHEIDVNESSSVEEYVKSIKSNIRIRALEKLTKEEKEALGLE